MDIDCWHFNCDWPQVLWIYKYWFVFKEPILGLSCWLWMDFVHVCLWSECGWIVYMCVCGVSAVGLCTCVCGVSAVMWIWKLFLTLTHVSSNSLYFFQCFFHNDSRIISIWRCERGMCNLVAFWFGYWSWHAASFLRCAGVWARILKLVCLISWSNSRLFLAIMNDVIWWHLCQLVLLPVDWLIVWN